MSASGMERRDRAWHMVDSPRTVLLGLVCGCVRGGDAPRERGLELLGGLDGSCGSHYELGVSVGYGRMCFWGYGVLNITRESLLDSEDVHDHGAFI